MKISVIQCNSREDKSNNIANIEKLMREAVEKDNPRFMLLPEYFDYMGSNTGRIQIAETYPNGEIYKFCSKFAKEQQIYLQAGSYSEKIKDKNKVYNTSVVFDPAGREIGLYRKIHLFDVIGPTGEKYLESSFTSPGDRVVVFEVDGIKVGTTTCYDLRFSELFLELSKRGVKIITVPAAFTLQTGKDHWEILLRARAIESQVYIVAANQVLSHKNNSGNEIYSYGHSMIVDPWGVVLAKVSNKVGFASSSIDLSFLDKIRKDIPISSHRRLKV